jgi:uncharacterized pyridoxamine 5'-phosphate oxidase family protein
LEGALKKGNEIVLATCSKDKIPNAIVVISQGFVDKKLLINCCQMRQTLKNIKENKKVCIVAKNKKEYYRIRGNAKIYASGKYFNASVKRNGGPAVQCSIVVDIKKF